MIEPRRFGLKHDPPCLVLEYQKGQKLRHYEIHFKEQDLQKDAKVLAQKLMERHGAYFNPDHIAASQLQSLIERLQRPPPSTTSQASALNDRPSTSTTTSTTSNVTSTFGDLNKVSEKELQRAKKTMNLDFEKHRLRPDDPNYEWDKQKEFQPEEPSDWDDEEEDF